jgi:outer membrane protein assembly factor BamB
MKNSRKKIAIIALVLVLTISAILTALPFVAAHDPPLEVPTWTYLTISYNPIGVNQQTLVVWWCNVYPPMATGIYGDHWQFTVEITKPDGSTELMGPYESDPVGGGWLSYTPDQVGTYTFVAHFLEHTITGEPIPPTGYFWGTEVYLNDVYLASDSDPVDLIVQEDPIDGWEEPSLPTEYWTRPINNMNREWYRLAGNWLAGAAQNVGPTIDFGYGEGPESAHVMWATPMWAGGIMDERYGNTGYAGLYYEGLVLDPPIILNGKLYYNVRSFPQQGWRCLDLYTGEELYFHETTGPVITLPGPPTAGYISGEWLSFGQILDFECPNQHGGFPYLWSTPVQSMYGALPEGAQEDWIMFDAFTGNYICSIANVSSSGTQVYGHDGSILYYNIAGTPNPAGPMAPDVPPYRLTVWNSTQAIWWKGTQQQWDDQDWSVFFAENYWYWRPVTNVTYDGSHGFFVNVSIPNVQGDILAVREGEFLIGGTGGTNNEDGIVLGNLWCLSLERGQEGTLLWNRTFTPPSSAGNTSVALGSVVPEDGVFLFEDRIKTVRWGYSLDTMELLWGPSDPEHPMNFYGMGDHIYDGKILSWGYGGELVAYNITTGKVLWTYVAEQEGFESPYGNYPIGIGCIADGKIYAGSVEHSPSQPLWRGSYVRCIDANTGDELWKTSLFGVELIGGSSGTDFAIADGYLIALNNYDNQLYCFGKGPSATTVTAGPKVTTLGSSVVIEGTVTDECAGAKKLIEEGKQKIVAAISDEDQGDWMEYLYMQQAIPMNAKGVEVTLDAIDPNGNFIHIDTVRSDMSGMFSCKWTPEHEGKYTVIATFEGSKAYYSSYAEASFGVDPAPAPTTPIEPEPTEPTEAPFITTEIAIILAVVVVAVIGIVAYWQLRKRK